MKNVPLILEITPYTQTNFTFFNIHIEDLDLI